MEQPQQDKELPRIPSPPPTREQLRDKLKSRLINHKMSRATHKAKEEKLDNLKEKLNEILKPTGISPEEFMKNMSNQNFKQFK